MEWLHYINPRLNDFHKIYILGADLCAKKILYALLQYGIKVEGFITNQKTINELYGLPVLIYDQIHHENAAFICDMGEPLQNLLNAQEQIFCVNVDDYGKSCGNQSLFLTNTDNMEQETVKVTARKQNIMNGQNIDVLFSNFVRCEFLQIEADVAYKFNAPLAITMMLSRCKDTENVVVIGNETKAFWFNIVETLSIRTEPLIILDKCYEQLYELSYKERMETLVLAVCIMETSIEIQRILGELGLKRTVNVIYAFDSFSGHITEGYMGFDWLLGNTYNIEGKFPGFTQYRAGAGDKVIVVIGNSASDPLFYPQKSWTEYLSEIFLKEKKSAVIYNGAVTDYSSSNELVKLIRDVLLLKPDIVISYSGFIDFREYMKYFPYINLNLMKRADEWQANHTSVVYGVHDERSSYTRWLENERSMQAVCGEFNIKFYAILQPWVGSHEVEESNVLAAWYHNYWSVVFPQFSEILNNAVEFKTKIGYAAVRYDWLYDFTEIFAKFPVSHIFYDSIHVNEIGNRIVAQSVYEIIKDEF